MITLYGITMTRTRRNLWLLEELGLEYVQKQVSPREPYIQSPEYKTINPMGKVPSLVDGDLVLNESMAINLYLARRYGASWWPQSIEDEARLLQWTFFAVTEMDPLFFIMIVERLLKPENARNEAAAHEAGQSLERPLRILDNHLTGREYIHGNAFSLSDLNVSAVCLMGRRISFDFSAYGNVQAWLERCWSRSAFRKVDAMT